jgi:RimJ/RimL family protein N-acetyltransferase
MNADAPRVILRALRAADAPAMFAYRSDPEVGRYQSWEPPMLEDVRAFIEGLARSEPFTPGTWYQLGVALASTGELIGDCGVHIPAAEPRSAEFGITLASSAQGRGLAAEALRALLAILFGTLGSHRVFCSVDPRNARSVALMRRSGFRQEAHHRESLWFKGAWADDLVFAMLRREWVSRGS